MPHLNDSEHPFLDVSGTPHITVQTVGDVCHIGVNRPAKRNAFTREMNTGLARAYQFLADTEELRVGVVFGQGDHFSAGLDLADVGPAVASGEPFIPEGLIDPYGIWGPACPKPIVLALQGIAFTLSIELALASDIVVAASDVRLAQLEVARGIVPFGGATIRAVRSLGWGNAMSFLLTAREFGADEAFRIGLVQHVVEPGEEHAMATTVAEQIAAQAPLGVQATLRQGRLALDVGVDAAVTDLRNTLAPIMNSDDAAEGLAAFLERRDGRFTGR